jgi:hypothetical protein
MAEYRIWERVERMGAQRYAAFVCAVPDRRGVGPAVTDIRRRMSSSPHVARLLLGFMTESLRDAITARGDRVEAIV